MAETAKARATNAASDDKDETPTPAQAVAAVEVPDETPRFAHDRLITESSAFGFSQPSWVVAGALSTVKKKLLTPDEVEAAIKAFLATEVS